MGSRIFRILYALLSGEDREAAADDLIQWLKAEGALIFVKDEEAQCDIPIQGFRQTLPQVKRWRQFAEDCRHYEKLQVKLPVHNRDGEVNVTGIKADDGTLLVYWGEEVSKAAVNELVPILPLVGAAICQERRVKSQQARMLEAQRASEELADFATALEATRKQLQDALAKAEAATKAKSTFLANMSHEVRTPLTAIRGFTDLLISSSCSDDERAKYLRVIQRNGTQLSRLVDDILDLSKVEAKKLSIEQIEVKLTEIFDDLDSLISLRVQEKEREKPHSSITWDIQVSPDVPQVVVTDPGRLRQILFNVVGNALKFTKSGSIDVAVDYDAAGTTREDGGGFLVIDVTDTGIGLSKSQQALLFKPFSQADSSTSRRFGGTGLGLQLSRDLAQTLGGDVTLVWSMPDEGSTFRITVNAPGGDKPFPQKHVPARQAPAVDTGATGRKSEDALFGIRVLVVDDNADNRTLVSWYLKKAGAHVQTVESGEKALVSVKSDTFDVVLMDIQMPGIDGYETLAALREQKFCRPVIALSAHAMEEEQEKAKRAGFTDYLPKPINRKELINRLASHLFG